MLRVLISCAVLSTAVLAAPAATWADDPYPAEVDGVGVTAIEPTSATFSGSVLTHGLPTTARFVYGTTPALLQSTPEIAVAADEAPVRISVPVTGLRPGTHYYVALQAASAAGGEPGRMLEFTTSQTPTVAALPVTDVGPLSATLHVRVAGYGLPVTLTGTVDSSVAGTPEIPIGPVGVPADGDVALPVAGLQPKTSYRWSVTAVSPAGRSLFRGGARGSFQTPPLYRTPRPTISAATAVYGSPVTLTGALPSAAGLPVALQQQPPYVSSAPFVAVPGAIGTLDAAGRYAFTVRALQHVRLGVVAPGYAAPDARNTVTLAVRAAVTAHVTRARHQRFAVSGRYAPDVPGQASLFRVGHGRVGAPVRARRSGTTGRAFRFAARVLRPGRYEVRVTPDDTGVIEAAHSARFTIPRR